MLPFAKYILPHLSYALQAQACEIHSLIGGSRALRSAISKEKRAPSDIHRDFGNPFCIDRQPKKRGAAGAHCPSPAARLLCVPRQVELRSPLFQRTHRVRLTPGRQETRRSPETEIVIPAALQWYGKTPSFGSGSRLLRERLEYRRSGRPFFGCFLSQRKESDPPPGDSRRIPRQLTLSPTLKA